jgi:uncharacterized Zn-finger protein
MMPATPAGARRGGERRGQLNPLYRDGMQPPETIEVETRVVACDGGDAALGHPRVYLNMGDEDFVECPYCDRRFVLKPGARGDAH